MIRQIIRSISKVNTILNVFSVCVYACVCVLTHQYEHLYATESMSILKDNFQKSNLSTTWVPETELESAVLITGTFTH